MTNATAQNETTAIDATVQANSVDAIAELAKVDTAPAAPTEPAEPKATPKYLVQRAKRQRFSFGNTWLNAVLAGVVTDKDKLVAHGVHLKAGTKEDLAALDMETLIAKVQEAIMNEKPAEPAEPAEPAPEPTAEVPAETPAAEAEAEVLAETDETVAA